MGLSVAPGPGDRVKQFPPRDHGVLLPVTDRVGASLGIAMFTASKPLPLAIQRVAFELTRRLGTWVLPGRATPWVQPLAPALWSDLLDSCRSAVGPFDCVSVYRRRQTDRSGATILLCRGGAPLAVVKVRPEPACLAHEQAALSAVRSAGPRHFGVPEPLGLGSIGDDVHWSAQSAVFDAPHRPVFELPRTAFDEITEALGPVVPVDGDERPCHHDLTPWNVRRDRRGRTWVFDWEDVRPGPARADEVYFHATAAALGHGRMPTDVPDETRHYWAEIVEARSSASSADRQLAAGITEHLFS